MRERTQVPTVKIRYLQFVAVKERVSSDNTLKGEQLCFPLGISPAFVDVIANVRNKAGVGEAVKISASH